MEIFLRYIIILLSLVGVAITIYINNTKKKEKKLVCPLNSDCNIVVNSEYSKFFGVNLEIIGLMYYLIIALLYIFPIFLNNLNTIELSFIVLSLSTVAVLFSIYLTAIQGLILKDWCTWCLISASISTLIFILMIPALSFPLSEVLISGSFIVAILHQVGLSLGLGGATALVLLWMRYLKDYRFSEFESDTIRVISQFLWFSFALVFVTTIAAYFPVWENAQLDSIFILRIAIFITLFISMSALEFIVSPKLLRISKGAPHEHTSGELGNLRKSVYSFGFVTAIVWYVLYFSGLLMVFNVENTYYLLAVYVILIAVALIASSLFEKVYNS